MMNKLLVTTSMVLLASSAFAQDDRWPHWYIGLGGGVNFMDNPDVQGGGDLEVDNGYSLGASLGYQPHSSNSFVNRTRYEIEYNYQKNEVDGGSDNHYSSTNVGANAYYDFETDSQVTPYLGLGIGMSRIQLEDGLGKDNDSVPSYQVLTGIEYAPETLPNTGLSLGYRFRDTFAKPEFDGSEIDYMTHSLEIGTKFRF